MRIKSPVLGTAAVMTALLTAGLATVPAQAQTPTRGTTVTLPAAPADSTGHLAAGAPSLSPEAPYIHVVDGTPSNCAKNNLCLSVWDYTKSKWKVYSLDPCKLYKMINWEGAGYYYNNQTTGTVSRFYDQNGKQLWTSTAVGYGYTNWSPVWAVRNC